MLPSRLFTQELRATFKLSAPLAIAQISQVGMGVTDTVLLGALGGQAIAAGGLGSGLFFMSVMVLQGPASAAGILVAHARGAGQPERIAALVRAGLALATLALAPLLLIGRNLEGLLLLINEPPDLAHATATYVGVLLVGAPAALWLANLRVFLASMNRPRMVMGVACAGLVVNAVLNYALIHGRWGFPELGFLGSSTATSITTWLMLIVTVAWIKREPALRDHLIGGAIDWRLVREIAGLGWPIAVTVAVEAMLFTAGALMMGTMGVIPLAAHQVTINVASLTFMVPLAVSQAANVRVGFHVGGHDAIAARRAGFAAFVIGVGFMSLSALALFTVPREIAMLFSLDPSVPDNARVLALAAELLVISAFFQIFDGAQVIAAGALRGLKDTRTPMVLAGVGYWLVGFPTAWIMAFNLGVGPPGVWWGLALGLAAVACVLTARFVRASARLVAAQAAG